MSNPVLIYSGIVWKNNNIWYFGKTDISKPLEEFFGKRITLCLHHWPDEHENVCFKNWFCEKHKVNPNFMYNFKEEIVLKSLDQIPFKELEGHHSRIICVWEDFEIPLPNMDDVKEGSEQLEKLLKSLQKTLEEIR